MRAIQVHRFGGPETLEPHDVPEPEAGPGQVTVTVAAADVIYLDTLLRSGWGGDFFPLEPPYVPGGGVAGTVAAVGEGVDAAWLGRRVVTRADGGYAERVVTGADGLVEVPDALGLPDAAALVHDGVTALSLARLTTIEPGTWVLVAAAAGGAGSLLVQLARDAGARVVAAARGERKLGLARDLGADAVVDYSTDGWQDEVRRATGGAGARLSFDGAGGDLGRAVFEATADGGTFVTYGTAGGGLTGIDPQDAAARDVRVLTPLMDGMPDGDAVRALLAEAVDLAAAGRVRPVVGATFPLERARDAHESLARRATVGKSLLLA